MKRITINVISAVLIVMIMAVANRMTVKKTAYEDVWYQGTGVTHATVHKTEAKLITGEVISDVKYQVEWNEDFYDFLNSNSHPDYTTLGFR